MIMHMNSICKHQSFEKKKNIFSIQDEKRGFEGDKWWICNEV